MTTRVAGFGIMLASVGLVCAATTPQFTTTPNRAWQLPLVVLVAMFAVCEWTALHVEIRKESHSLSLSAIPLMFGLLYVSPLQLMISYTIGSTAVLLLVRRSGWLKSSWNACLFIAEAGIAGLMVRSTLGLEMPARTIEWLIPLGAVLLAELLSLVCVPLVIMAVDLDFKPRLFANVGQSQLLAALAGTFTVAGICVSSTQPTMAAYAFLPMIGVGVLLRSAGQLSQRFKDLQQLQTFTQSTAHSRDSRTLDNALVELVDIMRCRSAGLLIDLHDDSPALRALVDDRLVDLDATEIEPHLKALLGPHDVIQIESGDGRPSAVALLGHLQAKQLLAVRVLSEVDHRGVLFIADRLGMRPEFNDDECRLFRSLATTLSARLSNDHLVERLEQQARTDALTALPNRLSFEVAMTATLARPGRQGVVVMIDLDRFKEINDSLGHKTGDRLLVEMADRLRFLSRPGDLVARFGGDEFAMLLECPGAETPGAITASRIAEIHRRLTDKVEIDGIRFDVGASVGVVPWPHYGKDSTSLLQRADAAMYQAKREQLGVLWYSPDLDADAPRHRDLYLSASEALDSDQFYVVFQPKVSLVDGRITGAEVLSRWTHPVHGPISPTEFVPLLVQAGLIGKLTRRVIAHAVVAAKNFRSMGLDIPVAVNFTPRDLLDPLLAADVQRILRHHDVPATCLQVEITEDSMVVDFETSISGLNQLRDLGVRVAIDDFGTGYSSLQHLHRLPVDQLKIDQSFVSRMTSDESARAIVTASLNLAHDLGLSTVAEGVEDIETLQLLGRHKCREVQGYLISAPLTLSEFRTWAQTRVDERCARQTTPVDGRPLTIVDSVRHRAPEPALSANS